MKGCEFRDQWGQHRPGQKRWRGDAQVPGAQRRRVARPCKGIVQRAKAGGKPVSQGCALGCQIDAPGGATEELKIEGKLQLPDGLGQGRLRRAAGPCRSGKGSCFGHGEKGFDLSEGWTRIHKLHGWIDKVILSSDIGKTLL